MPQSFKDDTIHDPPLAASGTRQGADPADAVATGPRQVLAGRYELLGLVGIGGMGSVYRARDLELEEVVAVKVLRRELSGAPEVLDRFRREVRLSRKVTHPNVARVFDIGEHEGDRFLTMEFIEGEPLAALLARERRLAMSRALDVVEGVCAGLEAAHRAGVIHRDLKPDNVLLGRDGRVVLTDFGIARAVASGEAGKTLGARTRSVDADELLTFFGCGVSGNRAGRSGELPPAIGLNASIPRGFGPGGEWRFEETAERSRPRWATGLSC